MFKTAIFKLHNPSKKKHAILQKAFRNYHLLYDKLLETIHKSLDDFYVGITYTTKKGKTRPSDRNAAQYIGSQYNGILNAFVLSKGLKESLCKDLAGNLLSYKELLSQRPNTSYPSLQKLKEHERDRLLQTLYESFKTCVDKETEDLTRDAIARQSRKDIKLKPLSFIRCDTTHQNMAFLYKPDEKKYYALVHIVPSSSKKLNITKEHGLYDIRTGEQYVKKTSTGVLFNIETGQRMVDRYLNGKSEPKEGKIVYDSEKDEYYLHLAFEFKPEKIATETIMGIDRGIAAICAFTVIGKDYKAIERGIYEGKTLQELLRNEEKRMAKMQRQGKEYKGIRVRKNLADRIIHEATNMVADTALKHRSQVYAENLKTLTDRSKKRKKSAFNKMLNRSQYQKFLSTLDYKLEERGLPKMKDVYPAYTSMTCVKCGNIDAANRPKSDDTGNPVQDKFKCIKCGYEDNADINASHAIAIKGIWTYIKKDDKEKRGIEKFQDFLTKEVIVL